MIDFSKLKAMTIPEGPVAKILSGGKVFWKKSAFPAGYTLLDYIESDGNQYIDTGIRPNQSTRVDCKAQYTDIGGTGVLFGYRYSNSAARYEFFVTGGNFYSAYGTSAMRIGPATTDLLSIDKNANITFVNGDEAAYHTDGAFQGTGPMFLFGVNRNGTPTLFSSARMYSCQIYDGNDVLVRDFVPCMNASGEVGMYDRVSGKFFENKGAGEFTYGHAFVEHIETSGTQYIDTGVVPDNNSRVVMDFAALAADDHNRIFGCRTSSSTRMFMFIRHSKGMWRFGYGDNQTGDKYGDTGRHTADINKNTLSIDGGLLYTLDEAEFTAPCALALGALASNSGVQCGYVRMYSCQIYDNGTLVRDFVPALTFGGEYGMMDKLTGVFYGNAGAGAFIGPMLPAA